MQVSHHCAARCVVFDQLKQEGRITAYANLFDAGGSISLSSGDEATFSSLLSPTLSLVGQANFIAPSHNLTIRVLVTGSNVAMSSLVFNS